MAALPEVNAALLSLAQTALTAAGYSAATTCLYYPTDDMITGVADSKMPLVSIYLRQSSFQNRNMRYRRELDMGVCGTAVSLNSLILPPGSITLTLSYAVGQTAVQVSDAVAFYAKNGVYQQGASYTSVSGDTLATMATNLAAAINTNFIAESIIATASGAVVTITNNGSEGFQVATASGNVAIGFEAVLWASRTYQIITYSATLDDREALQGCIENMLAAAEDNYGVALTSGEFIRIKMNNGRSGDADVQKDVYRDDFIFTVDHAVDETQNLYTVLMPDFAATPS